MNAKIISIALTAAIAAGSVASPTFAQDYRYGASRGGYDDCQRRADNGTATGAVIGGVTGAVIGSNVSHRGNRTGGGVVGALLGAVIGGAVAHSAAQSSCENDRYSQYDNGYQGSYYQQPGYGRSDYNRWDSRYDRGYGYQDSYRSYGHDGYGRDGYRPY